VQDDRNGGREGRRIHTYFDVALVLLLHELGGDGGECAVGQTWEGGREGRREGRREKGGRVSWSTDMWK